MSDNTVQVGDRVEIAITGTVVDVRGGKYPCIRVQLDSDRVSVDDDERVTAPVIPGADLIAVLSAPQRPDRPQE